MSAYPGLHLNKISSGYGGKLILKDLSAGPFKKGEVVALVGPNAAGKSTLLRSIAGLIHVKGDIYYDDAPVIALSLEKRSSLMGFMPQSMPGDIDLNVYESLISALKASPLDHINGSSADVRDRAFNVLKQIGITGLAMKSISHLSGGQRQLVSFAQAIIREPEILLLDEPTSALDLKHQVALMSRAREYALSGKIVIVVMHDLNLAIRWCDQIMVMQQGTIEAFGTPEEVIRPAILKDVYKIIARVERCSQGRIQVLVDE